MVRSNTSKKSYRLAFTMIELIFAIVIISIAVVSLPMMTKITEKGVEEGILQEAIFAGSAELMGASAGYWDERSMDDIDVSYMSRVIKILGGINDCNDTTKLRPGHIAQPLHRRCLHVSPALADLDKTLDVNITSLDDAKHPLQGIFLNPDPDAKGYKQAYKSVLTVTRANDIKTITVRVMNNAADRNITLLRMQSANIGEIDYYKRRF